MNSELHVAHNMYRGNAVYPETPPHPEAPPPLTQYLAVMVDGLQPRLHHCFGVGTTKELQKVVNS